MHNRESILESLYWITYNGECIRDLQYSRPESMGSGSILQSTRVNGFWNYSTVDQSQGVLELQYSGPESRGSGAMYSTVDQSQWALAQYYRRPESMGSGTLEQQPESVGAVTKVQSTRVKGIRIFGTVDLSQWILERYCRGPESMGSVTIVQQGASNF